MNPTEVTFYSDGLKIAGYLYAPADWKAGDAPRPGILVLAGYSGNTQADCTHLMKRLCAEGWFVFGFDYQGFGKSEGRRNRHRALEQAQNCYDAISYMQGVPGLDVERIGLYGTSFGGANSPLGNRNTQVIRLLERLPLAIDPAENDDIHRQLTAIFRVDIPATFLFPRVATVFASPRVRGLSSPWRADPIRFIDELSLDDGQH